MTKRAPRCRTRDRFSLQRSSSSDSSSSRSSSSSNSNRSSSDTENSYNFSYQLAHQGLIIRSVPSDGNCLFSAFADQITGRIQDHVLLREQAVTYLRNNRREMAPFCIERPYEDMLRELSKPGTFGDHMSIVALARIFHVNVIIHRADQPPSLVARACDNALCSRHRPQVHLAYSYELAHYSSVRLRDAPSFGPANVYLDLKYLEKQTVNHPSRHHRHHRSRVTTKLSK